MVRAFVSPRGLGYPDRPPQLRGQWPRKEQPPLHLGSWHTCGRGRWMVIRGEWEIVVTVHWNTRKERMDKAGKSEGENAVQTNWKLSRNATSNTIPFHANDRGHDCNLGIGVHWGSRGRKHDSGPQKARGGGGGRHYWHHMSALGMRACQWGYQLASLPWRRLVLDGNFCGKPKLVYMCMLPRRLSRVVACCVHVATPRPHGHPLSFSHP